VEEEGNDPETARRTSQADVALWPFRAPFRAVQWAIELGIPCCGVICARGDARSVKHCSYGCTTCLCTIWVFNRVGNAPRVLRDNSSLTA
jgi:hypothetical protein